MHSLSLDASAVKCVRLEAQKPSLAAATMLGLYYVSELAAGSAAGLHSRHLAPGQGLCLAVALLQCSTRRQSRANHWAASPQTLAACA